MNKFPITEAQARIIFTGGVATVTKTTELHTESQVFNITQVSLNGTLDLTHDWKGVCENDGKLRLSPDDSKGHFKSPEITKVEGVAFDDRRQTLSIDFEGGLHIHMESKMLAPSKKSFFGHS